MVVKKKCKRGTSKVGSHQRTNRRGPLDTNAHKRRKGK
jgi:hypothetical protein